MDSERTEEYLEAIYKEQSKGESASTSFLARDLGVSQPAVTDMLKNLEIETGEHDGDSGPSVSDFDDKFIDPSTGERTDKKDSTLHDFGSENFQPMEGGASEEKWKNYEQDRKVKKSSLEEEVSSLRKSIDELKGMSSRRGIVTSTVTVPDATPSQDVMDRHLAQIFTGKLKA